jgi:hypothetical protein
LEISNKSMVQARVIKLSAFDSFWLAAINDVRCYRWRHSNINGQAIGYSEDVKLEKLFIKKLYELETLTRS